MSRPECELFNKDIGMCCKQDVKLTAVNDDQYFVFEDYLYQILFVFTRDTFVLEELLECPRGYSNITPSRCTLKGAVASSSSFAGAASASSGTEKAASLSASSSPAKAKPLPGKGTDNSPNKSAQYPVYPPNGIIPFHGFSTMGLPLDLNYYSWF